jgi:vacuolar-type H+-ATPase subunit I/STV1
VKGRDVEQVVITPDEVAWIKRMAALDKVVDSAWSSNEQIQSRKALFAAVDKQILARVNEVLPGILSQARDRIDASFDPEKVIDRVNKHRAFVNDKLREIQGSFESAIRDMIEESLRSQLKYYSSCVVRMVKDGAGKMVAAECSKQLKRIMNPPVEKPKPRKKAKR